MEIDFTKMHGNGNDFILIDEYDRIAIPDEMKGQFAAIYCDRRFGIGADGVIHLSRSKESEIRMRLFQPDQSEARCAAMGSGALSNTRTTRDMSGKPAR